MLFDIKVKEKLINIFNYAVGGAMKNVSDVMDFVSDVTVRILSIVNLCKNDATSLHTESEILLIP